MQQNFLKNFSGQKNSRIRNQKAFSLIELSLIILIIAIIAVGITQSTVLLNKYRLSVAKNTTQNSVVNSMRGVVFWYETTLEESFDNGQDSDGAAIVTWHDINRSSTTKYDASSTTPYNFSYTNRPIYTTNCINGLPCLKFDGVDDYMDNDYTNSSLTSFTIIMVLKYNSGAWQYPLSTIIADINARAQIFMSIKDDGTGMQNGLNYTEVLDSLQEFSSFAGTNSPYMIIMREKTGSDITTRINKIDKSVITNVTSEGPKNIRGISIGTKDHVNSNCFSGNIGEIIFFDRALKNSERDNIEQYLIKKWNIRIN